MKIAACLLALSAGVYSAAPADEPPSPVAQPALVQPQPAAVQAPAPSIAGDARPGETKPADLKPAELKSVPAAAAAAAAKAADAEAASAGPTEAQIKQMRGRGYKPVTHNGTTLFCRAEGEIGTHFQRSRCSTLEQLKEAELSGKEYVNSIQQQGSAVPFKGP